MKRASRPPRIGISLGDPSGIGSEVTAKALRDVRVQNALVPVIWGDAAFRSTVPDGLGEYRVVTTLPEQDRLPGQPTQCGARAQHAYIDAAIQGAREGEVDALCTAPVSKSAIIKAGIPFIGHTEMLADAFHCEVLMLMDGPQLKVALATNHLPLCQIPNALTISKLVGALALLTHCLKPTLKRYPRIAVCGLNPHAGEGGSMGAEEIDIIAPAIAQAQKQNPEIYGPLAADGLFAKAATDFPFDVALAMFHDQGLVASKTLDIRHTVNVTLGLTIPRTAPAHGVAYDIASRNAADAQPMICALLKAAELAVAQRANDKSLPRQNK